MAEIISFIFGNQQDEYAQAAQQAENERQGRITTGLSDVNSAFAGFTPSFYDERSKAYVDYAMPQLADQSNQARQTITTGLANRGLLNTLQARQALSGLARQTASGQQTIAEQGRAQANQLKQQVEGQKGQLINQLYQTADPASARQQSISTASSFQQPSVFAPISNMFSNLVNQYYQSSMIRQANQPVVGGGAPSYYDVNPSAVGSAPYRSSRP